MVDQPDAQFRVALKAPRYGAGSKKPSAGGVRIAEVRSALPAAGRGSIEMMGSGVVEIPELVRERVRIGSVEAHVR
jgi:hypothetical protein